MEDGAADHAAAVVGDNAIHAAQSAATIGDIEAVAATVRRLFKLCYEKEYS